MIRVTNRVTEVRGTTSQILAEFAGLIESFRREMPDGFKNILNATIEDIYENDGKLGDRTKKALEEYQTKREEEFIKPINNILEKILNEINEKFKK